MSSTAELRLLDIQELRYNRDTAELRYNRDTAHALSFTLGGTTRSDDATFFSHVVLVRYTTSRGGGGGWERANEVIFARLPGRLAIFLDRPRLELISCLASTSIVALVRA